MRKINLIFQEILKFSTFFLLFFIWSRYVLRNVLWAIFLALALTAVLEGVLFFLKRKKLTKQGLKLKEKEDAENMFLSLCTSTSSINFFVELAKKKHENVTKHQRYMVVNHVKENTKTVLYPNLRLTGLDIARFVEIYNEIKKEKAGKIVILCQDISDKALPTFIEGFDEKIMLLDEYETYEKLYKYYDFFPKITKKYSTDKKRSFKQLLSYSFNKQRTKGYLFSAIILVFSSLFLPSTIYYCVVASILIVFALLSQFNPYFNKKGEFEVI